MTIYRNHQNSNIFIVDSADRKTYKVRGANEQAFLFLYNENLFKKLRKTLELDKEKKYIKQFLHFSRTAVQHHDEDRTQNPRVITMGKKQDGGSLFIHKPSHTIFYYQKPSDLFFKFSPDFLNRFLDPDNEQARSWIPEPQQFDEFLSNYVKQININQFETYEPDPSYEQLESIQELKYFLNDLKMSNHNGFQEAHYSIYLLIDWDTLGYDFKTYDAENSQEFIQMALDLTSHGVDLDEREQDIWCNKLIGLLKANNELKSPEDNVRQDFYSKIQSRKENRVIKQQIDQSNKKQKNPSDNSEQTKNQSETKIL